MAESFDFTLSDSPWGLQVEYRTNPIGIDERLPRFAWRCPDGLLRQSAYEIEADGWSTGKVVSDSQNGIVWAGEPLRTSQRVTWRVRVWDEEDNPSQWSEPAFFTMGVMSSADWKSKWIGPNAQTRPEISTGDALWIANKSDGNSFFKKRFVLESVPDEPCEFVFAAREKYKVAINSIPVADIFWEQYHEWRLVRAFDARPFLKDGENEISVEIYPFENEEAHFIASLDIPEYGKILTDEDWEGASVVKGTLRSLECGDEFICRTETASPAFEKSFVIKSEVAQATLHITGVGFYEASLNGSKIGDKVLDPSPTDFSKRVLYSTYLLDKDLVVGENKLKVLVGHGWYDQRSISAWNFDAAHWRNFPRMIAQLEVVYADGTTEMILSDSSWLHVASPVGYDCIREGEIIGARDLRGPDLEKTPLQACEVEGPAGVLTSEAQPAAKIVREIKPVAIYHAGPKTWIVDFGENFAGWARIRLRGLRKGELVSFTYDERIAPGELPAKEYDWHEHNSLWKQFPGEPIRNIDRYFVTSASYHVLKDGAAFQRDRLIASGSRDDLYEPRFTFNGFQYVVIRGLAERPLEEDIVGCVISTDFPKTGNFESSDEVLNKLVLFTERSYRSNYVDGFPMDCPHREKNGWTGDAQLASRLAQYFFDNTAGYEKWLFDIADSQRASGEIPGIVPTANWGFVWGNGPGYDFALPVIMWRLYLHKGDRRILDRLYEPLKRLVDYTARERMRDDNLVDWGIPDWIPAVPEQRPDRIYSSSTYFMAALQIAAKVAAIKGLSDDAKRFSNQAIKTRDSIRKLFYHGEGKFDNGSQTAQSMALHFGLNDPEERPLVEDKLVEAVHAANDHVTVGIYGMSYLFRELSEAGYSDLAFKVLMQKTDPSPACWVSKGASTLWEDLGDGQSRNHIMFGDFTAWAFEYLAGIRPLETSPGGSEMVVAPTVIDDLSYVTASVDTPFGKYSSAWRKDDKGGVLLTITVPPNAKAHFFMPGKSKSRLLDTGTHQFSLK